MTLHDGRKFKKTFETLTDFEKFKKPRGFIFGHADYTVYDLKVA
tara:strand:+ start:251 stop:382 length:132 start_codon:yes stop_codon:yes gene_type:complete